MLELGLDRSRWLWSDCAQGPWQSRGAEGPCRERHGRETGHPHDRGVASWCAHLRRKLMSTLVHYFSPFREVVATLLKHNTTVSLSAYGAPSRKAVTLWSTTPLVKTLHRVPGKARERLSIRGKDGSVTGCRAALKSSQAYPKAFGEAVAGIIRNRSTEGSSRLARCGSGRLACAAYRHR